MIVIILLSMLIGLLVFNSKMGISMENMSYIITFVAFISIVLLMFTYNSHPECDAIINHNNLTLQSLQNSCYQYINT
jgi:hypothetical protein